MCVGGGKGADEGGCPRKTIAELERRAAAQEAREGRLWDGGISLDE